MTSPSLRQCNHHDLRSLIRFDFSHQAFEATTAGGPAARLTRLKLQSHTVTQHPELESLVMVPSRHATTALG